MTPKQTPYAPPGSHPPGSPAENHLQPLAAFPDGERCEGHGHPGPRDGSVRRRVVAAPAVAGGQCHPATSGASVEVADVTAGPRRIRCRGRRSAPSGSAGTAQAAPPSALRHQAWPARRRCRWPSRPGSPGQSVPADRRTSPSAAHLAHADHPDLCGLRPAWTRSQVTAVLFTQCEISRAFPRGCGLGVSSLAVLPPGSCLRAW